MLEPYFENKSISPLYLQFSGYPLYVHKMDLPCAQSRDASKRRRLAAKPYPCERACTGLRPSVAVSPHSGERAGACLGQRRRRCKLRLRCLSVNALHRYPKRLRVNASHHCRSIPPCVAVYPVVYGFAAWTHFRLEAKLSIQRRYSG